MYDFGFNVGILLHLHETGRSRMKRETRKINAMQKKRKKNKKKYVCRVANTANNNFEQIKQSSPFA